MTDRYTRRIFLALAEGRDLTADEDVHVAGCASCRTAAERARDFERALHRHLAEHAVPLPADPSGLPADRPTRMAPILVTTMAALFVIALGGGVALIAMPGPSPTPVPASTPPVVAVTARPSASAPAPSASATATVPVSTPTLEPSLATDPIIVGSYAQLRGADPTELWDRPHGNAFTAVSSGSELWIADLEGDWAQVEALDASTMEYLFGWVPLEDLVPIDPVECDQSLGAWELGFAHPQRQLECLADDRVVLEGYAIGRDPIEPAYRGEPSWLAEIQPIELSSVIGPAVTGFTFAIHLPPDLDDVVPLSDREAHEGTRLRITGHYDDLTSSECERRPAVGSYPLLDAELSERWCRQQFVVDSVEILDPES
jgi:hypothetical protein